MCSINCPATFVIVLASLAIGILIGAWKPRKKINNDNLNLLDGFEETCRGVFGRFFGDEYVCCNPECQWTGKIEDCVHPKHSPNDLLCPECYEVVQIL
jgi:hypothetical protein